jgi:Tol biopolymer transport system component
VDRAVAIKVLSAGILANPERRQRLEHSAKAASGLEHPNIARLHEFVHADGAGFVVLDAPEGESLYDFLDRERPRRRDLVRFARQMARALAAAHGAGIIHGPLNPDSIFINAKLQIRFYDFGFGVVEPPPDGEGARQSLFGHGIPYVSPEQVRGASPDARSDIFSLGALLYHMTTGLPAFRTGAVSETWKAIVEAEPKPIAQVTSRAPRGMAKLVERCLRKNPQLRFQQFGEIEPLLEQMAETFDQNPNSQSSSLGKNWGRIAKIGGFALAAAAGIAAAVLWRQRPPAPDAVTGAHFRQITQGAGYDTEPAASADGTFLAYASDRNSDGNLNIWIQQADGNEARQLTDDPADDREPAFAPDGETIAFRSERDGGGVFLVPAKGGPARLLAREGRRPRYSPDGRWIAYWVGPAGFAPKADRAYATFVIPAAGGAPRQLRPDFASSTYPVWSPDSKRLLFLGQPDAGRNDPDSLEWWVASLDGGQLNNTGACTLFRGAGVLPYTQMALPGDWKGNSVFFSIPATEGANIWRAGMAPDKLDVTAKPVRVTSGKGMEIQPHALVGGRVAFSRQSYNADIWGIPVSANEGKLNGDPKRWTRDPGIDIAPSLTADGTKLLFQSNRTGHYEPWLVEVPGGKDTRVTASAQDQLFPVISPDGSKVAYSEHRIRRFEQFFRPLGAGTAELLCDDCGAAVSGWSRDGKAVLIDSLAADKSHLSVSLIRLGAEGKTLLLEDTRYDVSQARFSPDGRWIVFVVRMGGVSRLYLTSYHDRTPLPSKEWIPLTDGKTWETSPQWSPDGKLVYFTSTRDGYRCVWAQHLDAANKPSGPAFAVAHFHTARSSPARLPFDNMDLFVGRDQILVSLGDLTGNIWMCTTSK